MKKKDLKIIRAINKEAWDKFGDRLMKTTDATPDLKRVVELCLNEERSNFTDEQIKNIETLKDLDLLDGKDVEMNEDVVKQFDDYTQKRLVEEIKAGNLSNPNEDKLFKKLQQDGRKKKEGDTK